MSTRGIDHLAIVADDMPTAMDFYTRVMGFRLVHVRRVPFEQLMRETAPDFTPIYARLRSTLAS